MSKFTSAYISFVSRLNEVEDLRRMAAQKEKADAIANSAQINALCRGAVVLLCSHVEAYVKEVGEVALTHVHGKSVGRDKLVNRLFYHISKAVIDEIKDTEDHDRLAEKCFGFITTETPYWSKVGAFPNPLPVDKFNKGFSNPGFKKISAYFNRFGYDNYKTHLSARLAASYHAVVNMVEHMVDTRNKIAHGNPAATKTPHDLKEMIRLVQIFCRATDLTFGAWCKANLCTIR
ncbi:hypothetical protein CfE428DRAFT_6387 [Chthoniobacter flavus Ellin428]|uniref:RiboL-PSP-HEPN domain-containing protein n=1 Tax=Chthoniobacter flavus Ellin428 TaxID=497964 RepID=B4DBU6_9BACT|nr:MAE_28990/MAE_18760 family HEPN-like nuclease [Chthoniobacter flavus]EDY16125.1 hypothetical protein CfE428DRAFT_6387 [Chthoniobacter flavus Ellin428]TCO83977.1 hypothetical protein EV701_13934 [Chthoniobacter flavus]